MRITLIAMLMIVFISRGVLGQNSQTAFSVESRLGYSTNTYLNPFFAEFDTSVESSYGVISLLGQSLWYKNNNYLEVSGGLILEPLFKNNQAWKGGLGVVRYQRRFLSRFTAGVETGGSYFTSSYDRGMVWAQPYLTWSPGTFTLVRVKAGSNFNSYRNYADSLNTFTGQRMDLYALEIETWPSFNLHLKAGLYGQLKTLPAVGDGFSSTVSAGYIFRNGAEITLQSTLQQYSQILTTTSESGGGGFPRFRPPRETVQTHTEKDRLIRAGLNGSYPITRKWAVFARADVLKFSSTGTENNPVDINMSAGVRFSFEPGINKNNHRTIMPVWDRKVESQTLRIHYKGEGRLYLVGDFNNWKQPGIPLTKEEENTYITELNLEPGSYEYKVLKVNGISEEWVEFSRQSYTVADGFGGKNALLLVE